MPHLPPRAPLGSRSDTNINPATTTDAFDLIVGVCVSIFGLVAVLLLIKFLILPWYRNYQAAKAAREKAIADQKAWYRSIRPIYRQPVTPRTVNAYMQWPHIQSEQERAVDLETTVIGEHLRSRSDTTQVSSADILSGLSRVCSLGSEAFPAFDPDHRPSIEAECDLSLQLLDSHQTRDTVGSVASIGVAVPVSLPVAHIPVEVYYGHRSFEDAGIFIVGDDEDA